MKLIIDGTALDLYPLGKPGFYGGTELYVHKLAQGLARLGHTIHVVTPDLEEEEQRGENLYYWPRSFHPTRADAVVMVPNLENIDPYSADLLILASNGLKADLGPNDGFAEGVDAVACFSQKHIDLLCYQHPKIKRGKCFITGLGVDLNEIDQLGVYGCIDPLMQEPRWVYEKVPGRLLFANSPERGLLTTLKIFKLIQERIPTASLHVTYDWKRTFNMYKWAQNAIAENLWECKHLMETLPNVVDRGQLSRAELLTELVQCQVHMYPSAPPNIGSQIHGITQMECAAAGASLVLSNIEAFPEIFGEAAMILPLPGQFDPDLGRRISEQDWADVTADILEDPSALKRMGSAARQLALENTWDHVVANWDTMLRELAK